VTKFLLIIILALVIISTVLFIILKVQGNRVKKEKQNAAAWKQAFQESEERAGRLQKALGAERKIGVKANAERKELNNTADADLVHRANSLFPRV
jgi:predicted Holliday junction resolvase-like endonuclease